MPQKKNGFETFSDGIMEICTTDERRLIGTKVKGIRFGDRTIGVQRYWQAKTAGNKVDRLLSIPYSETGIGLIETNDVVIIRNENAKYGGGQYRILQVQPKFDSKPESIYLSLEKIIHLYKEGRTNGGN